MGVPTTADDWEDRLASLTDEELWNELVSDLFETGAIIALAVALAVMIIYRRHRAERQRRAQENGVNGQQQAQVQQQNGVFPLPGDPAFMDWAVGGVGH